VIKGVKSSGKIKDIATAPRYNPRKFWAEEKTHWYTFRLTYLEAFTDNSVPFGGIVLLSSDSLLLSYPSLLSGCSPEVSCTH